MHNSSFSRTPQNVEIVPRNRQFNIEEVLATNWHSDDAFKTAFFDAMSILFPLGEQFFIDSVKEFREKIEDPELQRRVRGFMAQESIHRREHQRYNEALCRARGVPLKKMEAVVERRQEFARTYLRPIQRLSATVALEHLTAILRSGGRVVTGTDSPIDFNGISLHMNLRAMVKYGLTPFEALTTATRYAGEFLGEPLGVIRSGALADLAVCEGDPLSRIEDAAAVRQVMKNGEVFDIAALIAPFAEAPQTAAVTSQAPARPLKTAFWWHEADYVESSRAACCADPFHHPAGGRRRFVAEAV